jgi:hypothetical protein
MRLRAICRWSIGRIAWSPWERFIASPSEDMTIQIWKLVSTKVNSVVEEKHHEKAN